MRWWGWVGFLMSLLIIVFATVENNNQSNDGRMNALDTIGFSFIGLVCWMLWWAAWQ